MRVCNRARLGCLNHAGTRDVCRVKRRNHLFWTEEDTEGRIRRERETSIERPGVGGALKMGESQRVRIVEIQHK